MSGLDVWLPAPEDAFGCCLASVYSDGERCTCWQPVLDVMPSVDLQEGPMRVRRKACVDCAYRAGSPERDADGGAIPEYGAHDPFMCHQGAPRATRFVHPCGAVIETDSDDYHPVVHGDRMWLADGSPAEYCSGWAAVVDVKRRRV